MAVLIWRQSEQIFTVYFYHLPVKSLIFTILLVNLKAGKSSILVTCHQFHEHFTHAFFRTKVLFSSYVLAKKDLSYKKSACKTLMKSTHGFRVFSFRTHDPNVYICISVCWSIMQDFCYADIIDFFPHERRFVYLYSTRLLLWQQYY